MPASLPTVGGGKGEIINFDPNPDGKEKGVAQESYREGGNGS